METLGLELTLFKDIINVVLLLGAGILLGDTIGYHFGYKEAKSEMIIIKVPLPDISLDPVDT